MVLSVLLTYGGKDKLLVTACWHSDLASSTVYLCSSVLAFDPWHMVTSFGAYLLLTPTYVIILSMQVLFLYGHASY
jgi:cellulose synthase/poly-beta-1,6-N-acetylglucosamine synthase-like glycosyltransferase